jgi:MFS family permease
MSMQNCPPVPARGALALPARLPRTAAFYLLASITVSFLAGSMAPTPLYPIYQAQWGFSALTVTAIFSIYAAALLVSLLVAGRLSDFIGRRPVLIAATLGQFVTMGLFISADGPQGLMLARLVQGLVTGAALGAIGASMIDLDKKLGPSANAITPMTGTAIGSVAAGLMAHFLPAPTTLIYVALAAVYLVQAAGVVWMSETVTRRPGALASLAPRLALPLPARKPLSLAAPVLVAAWSLAGFYAALAPAVMRVVFQQDPSLGGGSVAFALAGSGALTVLISRRLPARAVMTYGAAALATGALVSVLSLAPHSLLGFLVGTIIAGTGFGAGFQGAVGTVAPAAQPHERAGVLSVLFVLSYVAMGLPAVVAGLFLAHGSALMLTAQGFGGFVAISAGLALSARALGAVRGA